MGRVLVVGGAGYVGCVLVEELLDKGYAVRILDRQFFGERPLERFLDRVELIEDDMRDIDESHVEDCSAVINVGGLSNDPTAEFHPAANFELNTQASIRLADVARNAGVSRLVFASSASVYDRGVGEDSRDVLLDEDSPVDPTAAYASSKLAAEKALLAMSDDDFGVTIFRKGTVFGFSPRMRYDLVVNTFVKDALSRGRITLNYGGEMWRPLIEVRDVGRAYVTALETDADLVRGQIFNLVSANQRISELALRVRGALQGLGIAVDIDADYEYRLVRNYRISGEKAHRVLGFLPQIGVQDSVSHMVGEIERYGYTDFSNPRYYNIDWMKLLEETVGIVERHGYVLTRPEEDSGKVVDLLRTPVRATG